MSTNRNDISQIANYLNGKLDTRAMHELEHAAQDDPFLMDAMDGYELTAKTPDQDIAALEEKLAARISNKRQTLILLWRIIPIAACLLLIVGGGYWFFNKQLIPIQTARVVRPAVSPEIKYKDTLIAALTAPVSHDKQKPLISRITKRDILAATPIKKGIALSPPSAIVLPSQQLKYRPIAPIEQLLEGKIAHSNYGALPRDSFMSKQMLQPKLPIIVNQVQGNPVGNVEELLQGKVANLNIQNNTGAPGLRGSVNIRGLSPVPKADTVPRPVQDKVIRGYVARDKKIANGKPYIISGKEVQDNPVSNVEQLLQGKVAKLNIKNNTQPNNNIVLIAGKITDTSGMPVSGAFVVNQHKIVAQSDAKGAYRAVVNIDSTLHVVSMGFNAQNLQVKPGQTTLNISLDDAPRRLAEVNIRGYVKRTRDQTTGSSYIITGKAGPCKENLRFKKKFLAKIAIVERYTFEHAGGYVPTIRDGKFLRALKFIAKRTKSTIKAEKGFADLKLFTQNKANWLYWYDANKCNNLK